MRFFFRCLCHFCRSWRIVLRTSVSFIFDFLITIRALGTSIHLVKWHWLFATSGDWASYKRMALPTSLFNPDKFMLYCICACYSSWQLILCATYIRCDSLIIQVLVATEVAVDCKCHTKIQKLMFLFSYSSHVHSLTLTIILFCIYFKLGKCRLISFFLLSLHFFDSILPAIIASPSFSSHLFFSVLCTEQNKNNSP